MRIHPRLTALTSLLLILGVGVSVQAQTPAGPSSMGTLAPPPPGVVAPNGAPGAAMFQPQFSTNNPAVLYPPGTPTEMQPWPAITPYGPMDNFNAAQESHFNRNGLWFHEVLTRKRTYVGSFEGLIMQYAGPGGDVIGSPYMKIDANSRSVYGTPVPTYGLGALPEVPNISPSVPGAYAVSSNRVFPFPFSVPPNFSAVTDFARYPIHNLSVFGNLDSSGLRTRWGWFNEDGTGLLATAWWGAEANDVYQRGQDVINGVPVTQELTLLLGGQNLYTKNGAIPLDNGEFLFVDQGPGSTAKYDVMYRIENMTRAAGGDLNLYAQPLVRKRSLKVTPFYGAHYMYLAEAFRFKGVDSGFIYDVDDGDGDGTFRPDSTLVFAYDQYTARLDSFTESHLVGPQVGLRFDVGGGEHFKIWGESTFAILGNFERLQVRGENIGDPLFDLAAGIADPPRMLDPGNDTTFNDIEHNSHVSPLFRQSIFAEAAIFEVIPGLNKMAFFEDAMFRVGYTVTVIGEVARPGESIEWKGYPLFPSVEVDRSTFWMQDVSFAIDWRY